MTGAAITLHGVSHTYQTTGGTTDAVRDFNLEIAAGEFIVVVGPSGCGKSTLLTFIAGLEKPDAGEVLVDGKRREGPDQSRILVFQQPALFPWLDVRRNVAFGLRYAKVPREEREQRIAEVLERVQLGEFKDARVHELSGGMRQRVALARALVLNPSVLLMDEPFAALDAQVRENLQLQLQELWAKERATIVFVTHDVREAAVLADRIVVMSHRPGTIKAVIPVDLPRPRQVEDHAVVDIAKRAREALSEEMAWEMMHGWR